MANFTALYTFYTAMFLLLFPPSYCHYYHYHFIGKSISELPKILKIIECLKKLK